MCVLHTVCGGGCSTAAAAAASTRGLMLMRSVMGENREREGNRLGLHWQAELSLYAAVLRRFIPHFSAALL